MTRRLLLTILLAAAAPGGFAQQRGAAPPPPPTAKSTAPIDLTGNWVSLVTNEWRWRMLTPAKGDYAVLPINAEARGVADTWDPARDEASGEQCRSYGGAVIMQVPGRLRVTWETDDAMRMDIDAGTQTRMFRFGGAPASGPPSWQGSSAAEWQVARGRGREALTPGTPPARTGTLKVVTTNLRPGYLRKNGVPYSARTVVTEYFTVVHAAGTPYLNVTAVVEDPQYLTGPYIRSMQFKREPDGSKFKPEPCSSR